MPMPHALSTIIRYLKRTREMCDPPPYQWYSFGFEILNNVNPQEYRLSGTQMALTHNSRSIFLRKVSPNSCIMALLKELEEEGKKHGNKHICGFRWVAEKTKFDDRFSVREFVEKNLYTLLLNMARSITMQVECHLMSTDPRALRDATRGHPPAPQPRPPRVEETRPEPMQTTPSPPTPIPATPIPATPNEEESWPLVIYTSMDRNIEANREWLNFLFMCQKIAHTLGVSHQEAVYHNCIKMEMARKGISHISHFHCVQKMPGGDVTKIGECDLVVELRSGAFLVELKVCQGWRKYENQVKKYINACYSMGYKIEGAAILNFNPRGFIECAMFEVNRRHTPSVV